MGHVCVLGCHMDVVLMQTLRGDSLERKYFEGEGAEEVLVVTITTRRKID